MLGNLIIAFAICGLSKPKSSNHRAKGFKLCSKLSPINFGWRPTDRWTC